jgi:hypothetical protein
MGGRAVRFRRSVRFRRDRAPSDGVGEFASDEGGRFASDGRAVRFRRDLGAFGWGRGVCFGWGRIWSHSGWCDFAKRWLFGVWVGLGWVGLSLGGEGALKTNLLFVVGALLGAMACSSTKVASDGGTDGGGSPSGSFDCEQSNCPNDPPVTAASKKACEDSFLGSCGGLYGTAGECVKGKSKCGADGKTDTAASLSAASACSKELRDYEACVSPDAGNGDGG